MGESMVPTMKSDLHENRHENLHGWRKIKGFFRRSKNALGALRFTYEVFWLVKGFMIPTVKGLILRRSVCRQTSQRGHERFACCRTARPRRSPATPAPGSAFMVLARPIAVH